jgi:Plant transposon protein
VDTKLTYFSFCQEAVRKDIERAFGILMQRFHFLSSCQMRDKEGAMEVLRACHFAQYVRGAPAGPLRSPFLCERSLRHLDPVRGLLSVSGRWDFVK